jgi:hypothetical protein
MYANGFYIILFLFLLLHYIIIIIKNYDRRQICYHLITYVSVALARSIPAFALATSSGL